MLDNFAQRADKLIVIGSKYSRWKLRSPQDWETIGFCQEIIAYARSAKDAASAGDKPGARRWLRRAESARVKARAGLIRRRRRW